jgi:hypothetical protein
LDSIFTAIRRAARGNYVQEIGVCVTIITAAQGLDCQHSKSINGACRLRQSVGMSVRATVRRVTGAQSKERKKGIERITQGMTT